MENTRLIDVLKTFTKDEKKSFGDFINSPYFNNEKVLIKLGGYLLNYHPDYSSAELENEKVFSVLYPGKKYSAPLMRNITSDMLSLAEKFLAMQRFEESILPERNFLLQELLERNLNGLFKKNLKKINSLLEKDRPKDENYYYTKYLIEDKKRRWMQLQPGKTLYGDDNIQVIADDLLVYFLVDYLKTISIMVNQKKHIYDHNFRFEFWEEIDSYLAGNPEILTRVPYAGLFYKAIKLFLTEREEYFLELRKLINKYYNILNDIDRKNMYVVLVNYCTEKINEGELKYVREKHELYMEILERGAHYESKPTISHVFFKGVVRNALELNEFEWTQRFISEYKNKLDKTNSESCYNYCLAHLFYKKKDYDMALRMLSKVSLHDVSFKLEVNTLMIMIYYDTDSEESLYSLFDSFAHILTKNRLISNRFKTLYINFINYSRELFKLKINNTAPGRFDISTLKKRINDDQYVSAKTWLISKVNTLLQHR
jgi:hypothetical protein